MLTALKAQSRPNSAHPCALPTFTTDTNNKYPYPKSDLTYIPTPNGTLITHDHLLIAWIYQGHAGSRNNKGRCQFYDVAYPTLTFDPQNRITGVMLDSSSFDTLEQAVQFIEATFAAQEATR